MTHIVKEIVSGDGARKVVLFRRDDGSFGFEEWVFSSDPHEMCWIPSGYILTASFHADSKSAERDARGRLDWMGTIEEDA